VTPDIIHLDNHLLVISKPAGMLSQSDETGDQDVVQWGKAYLKEKFNKPGNVFCGLVHRLDRPASGVMILARTTKGAGRLAKAFADRKVEKEYMALVEGMPDEEGKAEDYLAKLKRQVRVVRETHPEAQHAVLNWKVIGYHSDQALISVKLETGRSHQIRVQMSSRGWPLVGDLRYGAKTKFDGRNLALHAFKLELDHPTLKEKVSYTAPLPATWPSWCRELTKR
jgi:23S rRNA pseudouridine1911/1915/1917 synthase